MVAARGRDDARDLGTLAPEAIEVDQAAAHLEGAGGRVVLVLDPDLDGLLALADGLDEHRPDVLRRGREVVADERLGASQVVEIEEHRASLLAASNDLDWTLNFWPDQAALRCGESDLKEPA